MINIAGLGKEQVLTALYNSAKISPNAIRFGGTRSLEMTIESAAAEIKKTPTLYFDYVHARSMKVDLASDVLDPFLFDRDNGDGSAAKAIQVLRDSQK